ncbi:uncharacterized protein N7477_010067 [Penicillium maclennaniae]|uniref:uncharacterized protein n=1 Tax=Penicillium maclennaniae TaxID=1343394 RepID=UPI0025419FA1|nr:uncharacterized protein N7477_010067 [Penicillium maclennaniae]KAJ5662451.1 hypothetical protein N7477_010067 [Penicillium maclennaniae]
MEGVAAVTVDAAKSAEKLQIDVEPQATVLRNAGIVPEVEGSALDDQSNDTYYRRLLQAYFFGVGSGVDAAPRWT